VLVYPYTALVPNDGTRAQEVNLHVDCPPVGIVKRSLIETDAVVIVPEEYNKL
jgi:hypothetical protein